MLWAKITAAATFHCQKYVRATGGRGQVPCDKSGFYVEIYVGLDTFDSMEVLKFGDAASVVGYISPCCQNILCTKMRRSSNTLQLHREENQVSQHLEIPRDRMSHRLKLSEIYCRRPVTSRERGREVREREEIRVENSHNCIS